MLAIVIFIHMIQNRDKTFSVDDFNGMHLMWKDRIPEALEFLWEIRFVVPA